MIKSEIIDNIGVLTLDNAQKRNCLSAGLIEALVEGMEQLRQQNVRAVILRAEAGIKTWSAGHDVRELPSNGKDPLTYNDPLRWVVREIQEFPAPVIAMVEGGVWGGACEMVMSCDLVIAGDNATFAITPAKLGVPYNISGVLNFSKSVSQVVVKELLFTAQPVSAERAERVGMINHVVPLAQLEEFTFNLARQMAQNSPLVISVLKEELRVLSQAYPLMPNTFERIQGLRRDVYNSEDYREGIQAFFDRRKPNFTGK